MSQEEQKKYTRGHYMTWKAKYEQVGPVTLMLCSGHVFDWQVSKVLDQKLCSPVYHASQCTRVLQQGGCIHPHSQILACDQYAGLH